MTDRALDSRPIRFRIRFACGPNGSAALAALLRDEYVPALRAQPGCSDTRLLEPFPAELDAEIGATTNDGLELEFDFVSESARRDWVAQPVHDELWARAARLSSAQSWSGFHVVDGTERHSEEGV